MIGAAPALILMSTVAAWTLPPLPARATGPRPHLACTPAELERLRAAWRGAGPQHEAVAERVRAAAARLAEPVDFPPRGGQHNQWYQCDACQLGLETIDDTHHRCPGCQTVYSGPPYDDVLFKHKHGELCHAAANAGWAYQLTGERRYAEFAARILLGYAERYLRYPYHNAALTDHVGTGGRLMEQTLSEASLLAGAIAPAYDLIHDADVLSAGEHQAIRDGLLSPMLRNIDGHKAGLGNWQTWHNAAMIAGGVALGEVAWIEKALTQPGNGLLDQLEASVSEEGMWYENSWGYHMYTLAGMVTIAEAARRYGVDVWTHPRLRAMCLLPVYYVMPDGTLPRWGDDPGTRLSRRGQVLEAACAATRDPVLCAMLDHEADWLSVLYGRDVTVAGGASAPAGSYLFRRAGHAVLRTRGPAGLTAALTFSPFGGFHAHFDKLSFVLFGYGREIGVDPGRAKSQAYRLPIHGQWYRATLSHNTVMVDGASQGPAGSWVESFAANDEYAGVVAGCSEGYPGVVHRRLLLLAPSYALVIDDLRADKARHFDWLFHARGERVDCETAAEAVDLASAAQGLRFIQQARRGATSGLVRAIFAGGEIDTHLSLAGGGALEVLTGDGPGESVLDRVPMVMAGRRGTAVAFAAVIEPVTGAEPPRVQSVALREHGGRFQVEIERADGRDSALLQPDGAFEFRADGRRVLEGKAETKGDR